jgi:hypothetical protein
MKGYRHKSVIMIAGVILLAVATPAWGATARVTYTRDHVYCAGARGGPWHTLAKGMEVSEGQFIRTDAEGIVELTLPDGSVMRLAPDSLFAIDKSFFPTKEKRQFSARLFLGKVWSRVARILGDPRGTFDVSTPTAVVGVRGTVYNLIAAADQSTDVFVYQGRVGVAPPLVAPDASHEQIQWPAQVTEAQWEEIILVKLQKLHVGPDGRPGKPQIFQPEAEADAWVRFNQQRDAASR